MTLTKTEAKLLERAKQSLSGRVAVLVTVHTGYCPVRTMGSRERSAATSLKEKGLLEFINSDSHIHYGYNGVSTHGHESLWKITDAGRAVQSSR